MIYNEKKLPTDFIARTSQAMLENPDVKGRTLVEEKILVLLNLIVQSQKEKVYDLKWNDNLDSPNKYEFVWLLPESIETWSFTIGYSNLYHFLFNVENTKNKKISTSQKTAVKNALENIQSRTLKVNASKNTEINIIRFFDSPKEKSYRITLFKNFIEWLVYGTKNLESYQFIPYFFTFSIEKKFYAIEIFKILYFDLVNVKQTFAKRRKTLFDVNESRDYINKKITDLRNRIKVDNKATFDVMKTLGYSINSILCSYCYFRIMELFNNSKKEWRLEAEKNYNLNSNSDVKFEELNICEQYKWFEFEHINIENIRDNLNEVKNILKDYYESLIYFEQRKKEDALRVWNQFLEDFEVEDAKQIYERLRLIESIAKGRTISQTEKEENIVVLEYDASVLIKKMGSTYTPKHFYERTILEQVEAINGVTPFNMTSYFEKEENDKTSKGKIKFVFPYIDAFDFYLNCQSNFLKNARIDFATKSFYLIQEDLDRIIDTSITQDMNENAVTIELNENPKAMMKQMLDDFGEDGEIKRLL